LHIAAITTNLLYVHYHNVLDHSGVYVETWLPWQPSSLYHDDHHRYFHVNYGQSLTFWDRIGGTLYSGKKRYSEKSFSF
jgi:lathosterol oxidase